MKYTRPVLLAAAALALFISACSQPEDAKPSSLAPQFGTADSDTSVDATPAPAGGAYVLSKQSGIIGNYDSYYQKVIVSRYSTTGKRLWTRDVNTLEEPIDTFDYPTLKPVDVEQDGSGNSHVLSGKSQVFEDYATSAMY